MRRPRQRAIESPNWRRLAVARRSLQILILGAVTLSPRGFRRIAQREIDRADAADRNDDGFMVAADHPIVMRRSGDAANEAAGGDRHARGGVEIGPAVAPPDPRNNDAEPIGRIEVRRAHIARMPADEREVETGRSRLPGQRARVDAALRKRGQRLPLQGVRQLDDGLRWIERTGGRARHARAGTPPRAMSATGRAGLHDVP